ncbi:MAG TPA: DUF6283 family protein [Streptomyces sp.]|uniref:DUF6283 family protein n=1 Tax=Streptomyces sp. TaxID=1931 RepID=UPI002BCCE855|nr:DUF6283 family protein [Streptomyces sp.]HWU05446.1 DUF6283 family protein [Streptomyces sp.]
MALEADRSLLGPEQPLDDEAEHDQRVRAHLAKLANARGLSVDEVLEALNATLSSGQPLITDPEHDGEASLGLPSSRKGGTVTQQRPADSVWGVTSVDYQGPPVAQRSPCAGTERCPWRRDAVLGAFPAEAFRLSAPTSYPDSDRRFGCHSSSAEAPRVCAGWLLRGASGNQQVLKLLEAGLIQLPTLPAGVELYEDYVEMAVANGVAEDDPTLAPIRRGRPPGVCGDNETLPAGDAAAEGKQDRRPGGAG